MKLLGEKLIDIHSQHQNLLLNKEGFQLNILDILAQDDKEVKVYIDLYNKYRKICHELEEFILQADKSRQDEDYIRFQLEQLEEAQLQEGEQSALEKKLKPSVIPKTSSPDSIKPNNSSTEMKAGHFL